MTEQENKGKVARDMEKSHEDISSVKAKVNELNSEKETWFNKKEELNQQIAELIKLLKKANPEMEAEKKKEKELKENRDRYNREFSKYLKDSKELAKQREELAGKFGRGTTPSSIKNKIEKMEYVIETEVLSIEKEKKIMKHINELRKVLKEAPNLSDFGSQMKEISENITKTKENADRYHNELKEFTKENKKKFKEYLANSRKVNELKKEQRKAFKTFIEKKNEYIKLNTELRKKTKKEAKKFNKKKVPNKNYKSDNLKSIQNQFLDNARIIEEKVKDVEKKLKEKKKLTTRDILAMQGKKE